MARWLVLGILTSWLCGVAAVSSVSESHALAMPAYNVTDATLNCNREAARKAREIMLEYVLRPHGLQLSHLPASCPFHPSKDMFADHEAHKVYKNTAHRQCKYCNKIFRSEIFLDRHLQRKHLDHIPTTATSCLSSLCDMLHCDWFATAQTPGKSRRRKPPPPPPNSMLRDAHCMPHEAQKTRHDCQELAHVCFPVDISHGSTSHHHHLKDPAKHQWDTVHEFWMSSFCQASTCTPGAREALLKVVFAGRRHSGHTAVIIVLLVLVAMAMAATLVCVLADKPTHPPGRRGTHKGRGVNPSTSRHTSTDPSGKLNRKPQPPPGFGLNQMPYVARRTPSATAASTVVVGSGALGARPGAPTTSSTFFTASQQAIEAAAGSVMSTFARTGSAGVASAGVGVGGLPTGLLSPQTSTQTPTAPSQVVWAGGMATTPSGLHQRGAAPPGAPGLTHAGSSGGGALPPPLPPQASGPVTRTSGSLLSPTSSIGTPTSFGQGPLAQAGGVFRHGLQDGGMQVAQGRGVGGGFGAMAAGLASTGPLLGAPWGRTAPPRPPDKAE